MGICDNKRIAVVLLSGLLTACAAGPAVNDARVVDLTYAFDENTIYWPADMNFQRTQTHAGMTASGFWYASGTYGASEHGGTHLDSPAHFAMGRLTSEQIPIAQFVGPAAVINIVEHCNENRDYLLSVADIEAWEAENGRIRDGAIVLVRTGWGRHWPDKLAYLGSDTPGDTANLHFPGISPAAAKLLASQRVVDGVGIDTASLDHGPSTTFETHQILSAANIYGLENVANIEQLPATGATIVALPMKIKGGTGGPARIIGILP